MYHISWATGLKINLQSFMVTESEALTMEMLMPVYVVPEDEQLLYMYEEVKQAAATKSASILIRGNKKMEKKKNYS